MTAAADLAGLGPVTNPRTDERHYPYPPDGEQLDSVTWLISATQSEPWFRDWYATSSLGWVADNRDLFLKVLDTQGRKAAVDLGYAASEQLRKVKSRLGVYLHDMAEALVLWACSPEGTGGSVALPDLPEELAGALYDGEPIEGIAAFMTEGFINFIAAFSPRVLAAEMQVYHQPLGLAGTLDLIIEITGYAISYRTGPDGADEIVPCPGSVLTICVDIKTGKEPKGTWKEQLAVYRRMLECLMPLGELVPMLPTDCGAVLHLRPEYPEGFLLQLVSARDDEPAWDRFLSMAAGFRDRHEVRAKPGPSIRPLRPDGTMPGLRLCDMAGEGWGRPLAPLASELGGDAELAVVAGFTAAELLAVRGIGPVLIGRIRTMLHGTCGLYLRGEEPDALEHALAASLAARKAG